MDQWWIGENWWINDEFYSWQAKFSTNVPQSSAGLTGKVSNVERSRSKLIGWLDIDGKIMTMFFDLTYGNIPRRSLHTDLTECVCRENDQQCIVEWKVQPSIARHGDKITIQRLFFSSVIPNNLLIFPWGFFGMRHSVFRRRLAFFSLSAEEKITNVFRRIWRFHHNFVSRPFYRHANKINHHPRPFPLGRNSELYTGLATKHQRFSLSIPKR